MLIADRGHCYCRICEWSPSFDHFLLLALLLASLSHLFLYMTCRCMSRRGTCLRFGAIHFVGKTKQGKGRYR
jgi:hypothetical protein